MNPANVPLKVRFEDQKKKECIKIMDKNGGDGASMLNIK